MLELSTTVNRQYARPISIYLAGKVQGAKWDLVKELPKNIADCDSSDGTNHGEHLAGISIWEIGGEEHKEFVNDWSIRLILNSDILIAYLDEPTSYGSIAEIAFASAHGKQCFVIIKDNNWEHYEFDIETNPNNFPDENPFFDAYWFVCAFPSVTVQHITTEQEARSCAWSIIYKEYHRRAIKSDHWKNLRMQAIYNAGNRCQVCNAKGKLHVHHRTYDNIGNEKISDVIVLCGSCHEKFHDAGKE